jgi:hypothetical protein
MINSLGMAPTAARAIRPLAIRGKKLHMLWSGFYVSLGRHFAARFTDRLAPPGGRPSSQRMVCPSFSLLVRDICLIGDVLQHRQRSFGAGAEQADDSNGPADAVRNGCHVIRPLCLLN